MKANRLRTGIGAALLVLCITLISYAVTLTKPFTLNFTNAGTTTAYCTLIQNTADTSDVYLLHDDLKGQAELLYPSQLDCHVIATETGDVSDSTYVITALQLSNDQTNWVSLTAMDTLTSDIPDTGATVSEFSTQTLTYVAKYMRVIQTLMAQAGDTIRVTTHIHKKF